MGLFQVFKKQLGSVELHGVHHDMEHMRAMVMHVFRVTEHTHLPIQDSGTCTGKCVCSFDTLLCNASEALLGIFCEVV